VRYLARREYDSTERPEEKPINSLVALARFVGGFFFWQGGELRRRQGQVNETGLPPISVAPVSNLTCTECAVPVFNAAGVGTLKP
jgi:hypothetical protein